MANDDETPIGLVTLPGCRCRCGHEWLSREKGEKPRVCPKCKSPNWDRPKRVAKVKTD
jgi:predicted Zn-ribbon and HTH transcriptional regulator